MPNYNQTLQTNNSSLEEIITQLNNLPEAGSTDTSDATATSNDILSGKTAYVKGNKITGTIPNATQATPAITINQNTGLITATATQTAGYVSAGTKSATSQMAFKAASTITPGTANQTAVAANTYVGGAITVKGDANLVASNIVSGKSIFGVAGTASSGGADTSAEDGLITRAITTYTNDRITTIGSYAFGYCSSLTTVRFPACTIISNHAFDNCSKLTTISFPVGTTINQYAFYNCSKLTTVSFPACTSIGSYAFGQCYSLTTISLPACTIIGSSAFYNCSKLTTVSFPACTIIHGYAFERCSALVSIYLGASTICSLSASNAFSNTRIKSTTGSIFVPASLVSTYKSATNWTYFSNRIFSYSFSSTVSGY